MSCPCSTLSLKKGWGTPENVETLKRQNVKISKTKKETKKETEQ